MRTAVGILGIGLLRLYDQGVLRWGQLSHTLICPGNERQFERMGMDDLAAFVGCGLELSATRQFAGLYPKSFARLLAQAACLAVSDKRTEFIRFAYEDGSTEGRRAYYGVRVEPGEGQALLLASTVVGVAELAPQLSATERGAVNWESLAECAQALGLPDAAHAVAHLDVVRATEWARSVGDEPRQGHWGDFGEPVTRSTDP